MGNTTFPPHGQFVPQVSRRLASFHSIDGLRHSENQSSKHCRFMPGKFQTRRPMRGLYPSMPQPVTSLTIARYEEMPLPEKQDAQSRYSSMLVTCADLSACSAATRYPRARGIMRILGHLETSTPGWETLPPYAILRWPLFSIIIPL